MYRGVKYQFGHVQQIPLAEEVVEDGSCHVENAVHAGQYQAVASIECQLPARCAVHQPGLGSSTQPHPPPAVGVTATSSCWPLSSRNGAWAQPFHCGHSAVARRTGRRSAGDGNCGRVEGDGYVVGPAISHEQQKLIFDGPVTGHR